MRITDNNYKGKELNSQHIADLTPIANHSITHLLSENLDLLVFPQSLEKYLNKPIFKIEGDKLYTNNIMGFGGRNTSKVTITSRLAKDDKNDFFLHYMLQKVLATNIFNFEQSPNNEETIWDFWLYLFPYCLKKAYAQGLYKAYQRKQYNDANVKGTIDVKRHLLKNLPFAGKIAYTTKEHSYDNPLSQLIRHTIEYLRTHPIGNALLNIDAEMRTMVSQFVFHTQNTYNKNARRKVIMANAKPFVHPYLTEYAPLQKICLNILNHEKLTFGEKKDKIHGLLFDGAWLWEEYLNTFLNEGFEHPENLTGKGKNYLFKNSKQPIYPDFISKSDSPKLIGDAKYIPLDKGDSFGEDSEKTISIYYKTITYMYRFETDRGFLLYPCNKKDSNEPFFSEELYIDGNRENRILEKIGLHIPQEIESFQEFTMRIANNEKALKAHLSKNH